MLVDHYDGDGDGDGDGGGAPLGMTRTPGPVDRATEPAAARSGAGAATHTAALVSTTTTTSTASNNHRRALTGSPRNVSQADACHLGSRVRAGFGCAGGREVQIAAASTHLSVVETGVPSRSTMVVCVQASAWSGSPSADDRGRQRDCQCPASGAEKGRRTIRAGGDRREATREKDAGRRVPAGGRPG